MNNLLCSWNSFIFWLRCVCLCRTKTESRYSREITSCHNYKCRGVYVCVCTRWESIAPQRWAASRAWVKAESWGRPSSSRSPLPEALLSRSCSSSQFAHVGRRWNCMADAWFEEKKSINYSLNVRWGQIISQIAQRLPKVINAFNFPRFHMLSFPHSEVAQSPPVYRLIIELN